ncbi:MAG: hypothetical protein JWP66_1662 [Naasia sp.]|nr:hypothetical protein [Naasia sp.]
MGRRRAGIAANITAVLAVLALAGCGSTAQAAPEPPPTASPAPSGPPGDGVLRIGALVPMTGDHLTEGPAQLAGIELAVREINEAGGVRGAPVQVAARDSGDATTATGEASFAELVARGADVVVGPADPALAARLLPLAAAASVALLSPTVTAADLPASGPAGWLVGVSRAHADPESAWRPSEEFLTRLLVSDPGLDVVRTGAEAYDATVLAALAALSAADDGGAAIARTAPRMASGPLPCTTFGECAAVLTAGADPAYAGVTGSVPGFAGV